MAWYHQAVGRVAQGAGRAFDYATPGSGSSSVTNAGRAVVDPNLVYTGMGNPFQSGFQPVAQPQPQPHQNEGAPVQQAPSGPWDGYAGQVASQATADRAARDQSIAYIDDTIGGLNKLLGRTGVTLDQGRASIHDSYNRNASRVNEDQGRVLRDYEVKRQDTAQDKMGALGRVDTGARTMNNNLTRLLGLAGSGISSAAQVVAPQAVAKDASQKRTGVFDTFGRNLRNISTAEDDAKMQFSRTLSDLLLQKSQSEQNLESEVVNQRNSINERLSQAAQQRAVAAGGDYNAARAAAAPYQQAIDASGGALDSIFNKYRNPVFNVAPVNVQTPNLADYTVDQTRLNVANQTGSPTELSPYLPYAKRRAEEVV